jgi:hypothetical protein
MIAMRRDALAVLTAMAAVLVMLASASGPVLAQPVATIMLPAPAPDMQLYPGCNNIALSFPDGTPSQEVMQAVSPAGSVETMWRHSAAQNRFEGYSAQFPQASDLLVVNFFDAVWLCMAEDLSAIGPPPVVIIPPAPICPGPPAVASFTAAPNTITAGQSSTLSWGPVENTDHVVIDQGIGEVAGWNSMVVTPATTTTYTLTATGCGGTMTYQVTVTVNAAPPAQFTADVEITDLVLQGSGANTLVLAVLRNNGPDNMVNAQVTLQCEASICPNNVPCVGNIIQTYQAQSILLSLAPGQTTQVSSLHFFNSNTDYTDYAKCTATVPWTDPNPANNTRTETPVQ